MVGFERSFQIITRMLSDEKLKKKKKKKKDADKSAGGDSSILDKSQMSGDEAAVSFSGDAQVK